MKWHFVLKKSLFIYIKKDQYSKKLVLGNNYTKARYVTLICTRDFKMPLRESRRTECFSSTK